MRTMPPSTIRMIAVDLDGTLLNSRKQISEHDRATLAEAAGAKAEDGDGLSLMPALTGKGEQSKHDFMYWEFPGYGGQQAVLSGSLKLVRTKLSTKTPQTELFDLAKDPGEKTNLATSRPADVAKLLELAGKQRVPSPLFKFPALDGSGR